MNIKTFPMTKSECAQCGHPMTSTTAVGQEKPRPPRPGDYSICVNCGAFWMFNELLTRVPIPPEVYRKMPAQQRKAMEAIQARIRQRGPIERGFAV